MVACDGNTSPTKVVPHIFLLQDSVPLKYLDARAVDAEGDSVTKWLGTEEAAQVGPMALLQPHCSLSRWNQVEFSEKAGAVTTGHLLPCTVEWTNVNPA